MSTQKTGLSQPNSAGGALLVVATITAMILAYSLLQGIQTDTCAV
jgi:hypothetical protein